MVDGASVRASIFAKKENKKMRKDEGERNGAEKRFDRFGHASE